MCHPNVSFLILREARTEEPRAAAAPAPETAQLIAKLREIAESHGTRLLEAREKAAEEIT